MSDESLVSVVVRTFNRADRVVNTIDSLRSQTYKNLEIVVIDDFSTDNTQVILMDLQNKDPRVKVFFNKLAKGAAGALQTGLNLANGQYIAFLDDDDVYFPEKIQEDIRVFNENPGVDVVVSGVRNEFIINDGISWLSFEFFPLRLFEPPAVMIKKEVAESISVRWGYMEWRDLAFQIFYNNFHVFLVNSKFYRMDDTQNSLSKHLEKMYEVSLDNAISYFEKTKNRTENLIFKKYLVNRYKNLGNFYLKKGRLFSAINKFFNAYSVDKNVKNLVPFT